MTSVTVPPLPADSLECGYEPTLNVVRGEDQAVIGEQGGPLIHQRTRVTIVHVPFDAQGEIIDVPGRILSFANVYASQVGSEGKVKVFVLLVELAP